MVSDRQAAIDHFHNVIDNSQVANPFIEPENPLEHFLKQLEGVGVGVNGWDSFSVLFEIRRGSIRMQLLDYKEDIDGSMMFAVSMFRDGVRLELSQIDSWEVSCADLGFDVSFWVVVAADGAAVEVRGFIPHE